MDEKEDETTDSSSGDVTDDNTWENAEDVNTKESSNDDKNTSLANQLIPCIFLLLVTSLICLWTLYSIKFKIPLWNYNSITITQQHLILP